MKTSKVIKHKGFWFVFGMILIVIVFVQLSDRGSKGPPGGWGAYQDDRQKAIEREKNEWLKMQNKEADQ